MKEKFFILLSTNQIICQLPHVGSSSRMTKIEIEDMMKMMTDPLRCVAPHEREWYTSEVTCTIELRMHPCIAAIDFDQKT